MSLVEVRAKRVQSRNRGTVSSSEVSNPETASRRLHFLTVALALLSGVIFTLTVHGDDAHQHTNWCMIEIVAQSIAVLVGTWFARRYLVGANALIIPPLLVMTAVMSLICEPVQRIFLGQGHAFEVLVMHCQANLMLALATCSFRRAYRQLCAILSLFLVISCLTKSSAPAVIALFGAYTLTAVGWLITSYWTQVRRRSVVGKETRFPKTWLMIIPVGLLAAILLPVADHAIADQLHGFMPSSGGEGDHDEFAHGGVGDGSDLIAGQENIQSFGPIEDAPFADDDRPSLYDAFNEAFDEPFVKPAETDRAIALPPEMVVEIENRIARSKQAGREFSTRRQDTARKAKQIRDLSSPALMYLAGRTPVHLRMKTFDVFDGVEWFESESSESAVPSSLETAGDRHWLRLDQARNPHELFSHRETHAIKIVNLTGNLIPSPPQTDAVSIDLVDRDDMYHPLRNGTVRMNRDSLPELTAIHLASNRIDTEYLDSGYGISWVSRHRIVATSLPTHSDMDAIETLAKNWTAGLPRGPLAIDAIVARLRSSYELDADANADPDSDFPVGDFLLRTRRGPTYMFASAAALLLRTQGYPTRLVGGFYASSEKYDAKSRHTPLHADDAHFWCEVHIGSGIWLTVEPSPGYEPLEPPPGLLAQIRAAAASVIHFVVDHMWLSLLSAAAMVIAFWNRRRIGDAVLTIGWAMTSSSGNREYALSTLRLIEKRFTLAGLYRPDGTTFGNWVKTLVPVFADRSELHEFARIANCAAFSESELSQDDRAVCHQLARELTFARIRSDRKLTPSTEAT